MTINELIIAAVTPVVAVCVPGIYDGDEKVYCTFNYDESGVLFAGDEPQMTVYAVQIHLYLPADINPLKIKRDLTRALIFADFERPTVIEAGEGDGQHYVFETSYIKGAEEDG